MKIPDLGRWISGFFLGFVLMVLVGPLFDTAYAVPAWARKYGANCTLCHSPYPRLNNYGQKFRRLGYRLPDEFTQGTPREETMPEKLVNLGNNISLRSRFRYRNVERNDRPRVSEFNAKDVTLFYVGPATDNLSFFFEANLLEDGGGSELEVGEVYYHYGEPDNYLFTRIGQFHAVQRVGFGGLDRPITVSTPLLLTGAVNGFSLTENLRGVEVGWVRNGTTLLGQITNGINEEGDGLPADEEDPAGLGRQDSNRSKDFAFLLEHLFGDTDSSVSVLYYQGRTKFDELGDNDFWRLAFFGNYDAEPWRANFLAGYALGEDELTGGARDSSNSNGLFGEIDYYIWESKDLTAVARYDWFDPSDERTNDYANIYTAALVYVFEEFTRVTLEYQFRDNQNRADVSTFLSELQFNF